MSARGPAIRLGATLCVSALLMGATAELAVRALDPTPRMQVIAPGHGMDVTEYEGVPLWTLGAQDVATRGESCAGTRRLDVAFVGDSVMRSSDEDRRARTFPGMLAAQIEAAHPDVCVMILAEVGYVPGQAFAELRRAHAAYGLDAVVFGTFKPANRYAKLGDVWVTVDHVAHDADDYPLPPIPVPAALAHTLFDHSRAWRYATLALARPQDHGDPWRDDLATAEWLSAQHIPALYLLLPPLDGPLDARTAARTAEHDAYVATGGAPPGSPEPYLATLTRLGLPHVDVGAALGDADVTALRLDTCCHYRPEGHRRVADALWPDVAALVDAAAHADE